MVINCYRARAPRDWVADPPRLRGFAVFGHSGAWHWELPPLPRYYTVFRAVITDTMAADEASAFTPEPPTHDD